MQSEFIHFNKINAFKSNALFLNYIDKNNIDKYSCDFSSKAISNIKPDKKISNDLAKVLKQYNDAILKDHSVDKNVEKLTKKGSFAVITGQQPHIYAGPMYTLYKIITAIKLCEILHKKTGADYIPVFWNGSDDHDIDEINKAEFPDKKYGLDTFRFDIKHTGAPIYGFDSTQDFAKTNQELFSKLRETEFTPFVKSLFEKHTENIGANVTYFYKTLFKGYGLVVLEPKLLRNFCADIYKRVVFKDTKINEIVNEKGKDNANLIHKHNASNLFAHINGKREKISIQSGKYLYNGKKYPAADFADFVSNNADKFSPGVSVRPAVQDYLFPTCAYVAGPGEIAYFSQLKSVYEQLNVDMPAIFPRVSATIITGREKRLLDKYGFCVLNTLNRKIEIPDDKNTEKEKNTIQAYTKNIYNGLDSLTDYVKEKGSEPLQSINSPLRKIEYELNKIEEKYIKAYEKMQGIERGHLEKLYNALLPNKTLQERVFTPLYYFNFFGQDLIIKLYENFNVENFMHHVLYFD